LIHGERDDNSGTFPIQSERLYQAVKGNGGNVRYVTLPFEAHGTPRGNPSNTRLRNDLVVRQTREDAKTAETGTALRPAEGRCRATGKSAFD
jgi:hypothetical protein